MAADANGGLALPPEMMLSIDRYAAYHCYSDSGELLYVGETGDLGKRLASHAQKVWFTQVRGITLEWYADELSALNAERRAIHVEHPKYNKIHRNSQVIRPTASVRARQRSRVMSARPSMTDDEMWTLAMKLADKCEQSGRPLTRRAFTDEYGGSPRRVDPLVKRVKEARAGTVRRQSAESATQRQARGARILAEFRARTGAEMNLREFGKALGVSKATAGEVRRAITGPEGEQSEDRQEGTG